MDQAKIGLVHERAGLQAVINPFAAHIRVRQPLQLGKYDFPQLLPGGLVAGPPGVQECGDIGT